MTIERRLRDLEAERQEHASPWRPPSWITNHPDVQESARAFLETIQRVEGDRRRTDAPSSSTCIVCAREQDDGGAGVVMLSPMVGVHLSCVPVDAQDR